MTDPPSAAQTTCPSAARQHRCQRSAILVNQRKLRLSDQCRSETPTDVNIGISRSDPPVVGPGATTEDTIGTAPPVPPGRDGAAPSENAAPVTASISSAAEPSSARRTLVRDVTAGRRPRGCGARRGLPRRPSRTNTGPGRLAVDGRTMPAPGPRGGVADRDRPPRRCRACAVPAGSAQAAGSACGSSVRVALEPAGVCQWPGSVAAPAPPARLRGTGTAPMSRSRVDSSSGMTGSCRSTRQAFTRRSAATSRWQGGQTARCASARSRASWSSW